LGWSFLLGLLCAGCAAGKLFQRHETVTAQETVIGGKTNTVYQTNIVYTLNAGVTNGLAMGRELARDVGGPWGGAVAFIFGTISTVLAAVVRSKNRIVKRERDQAALVPALITAIESAPQNEPVKREIEKLAKAAGLEDRLNAVVKRITK
jgi:hypothetical protein